MFESVLEQNIPRRRLGRGAMFSFAFHAALLGLAIYISSRPKSDDHEKVRAVTFFNPPPPPPPPPPPAGGGAVHKPKTEPKKIPKKPDTVVQTTKIEKPQEKPPDPTPDPNPAGVAGGVQGGVAGGVVGGTVGGTVGGQLGGQLGGTGTQVVPFGAGMQRPTVVTPPDIRFSREAKAAGVTGGVALLKCIINTDGTLSDCHLAKGLPYMDQQILEGVRSMRWSPVMYQGHPQRVMMTFPLRITSPG
jgi:protein TonB